MTFKFVPTPIVSGVVPTKRRSLVVFTSRSWKAGPGAEVSLKSPAPMRMSYLVVAPS